MKKTFTLTNDKLNPDRHLEGIKKEIRKYIKREKKKRLPEEYDFWNMDCKFGKGDESPKVIEFVDIMKHVDDAAQSGVETFYLEIIASPAKRSPKK